MTIKEIRHYFDGLVVHKFEIHETYATYGCAVRTYDMTSKQKYVLVHVLLPDADIDKSEIKNLRWFSITTTDDLKLPRPLPMYTFYRSQKDPNISNDKNLRIKDRNYLRSVYSYARSNKIEVILKHEEKKRSTLQFPDALTLHQAVDTFKCIIRRTDF